MSTRIIKGSQQADPNSERRKAERRPILDTFSVFVVVPKKSILRLKIHDLSELGVGFTIDSEGEEAKDFAIAVGEVLDFHFYLNQSLFLPLQIKVARIDETGGARKVGAEYAEKKGPAYAAFVSFVSMLDHLIGAGQIAGAPPAAAANAAPTV